MKKPFPHYLRRFKQRSALRLAVFAVLPLVGLLAPEPYSRFATVLGMLVNFISYETLLKKYREIAGISRTNPPPPPPPVAPAPPESE